MATLKHLGANAVKLSLSHYQERKWLAQGAPVDTE
jgi:hypothetical protein